MENNKLQHNLIVLGNGFDLYCDLNTRYSDYFIYRKNQFYSTDNYLLDEFIQNEKTLYSYQYNDISRRLSDVIIQNLNVWDIIFFSNSKMYNEMNWCNVEHVIHNFIVKYEENKSLITFDNVCYIIMNIFEEKDQRLWNNSISKINHFIAYYVFKKYKFNLINKIDNDYLYKIFLIELKSFENSFKSFIKNQQRGSNYYTKAHNLLEKLNFSNELYTILNFNYTCPERNYHKQEKENIISVENVHGDIYSETVIFGIDHTNVKHKNKEYNFTKTSRKIFESKFNNGKLGILTNGINNIVFYGHSLNFADYSYFQSIFDFCNLYNSNVNLIFYYNVHDDTKAESIKSEKFENVINLINTYGETLNPHQGKNLLHKLLLENRLRIIEI